MSQMLIKRHIFCAMNAHFTDTCMFNHMYISSVIVQKLYTFMST